MPTRTLGALGHAGSRRRASAAVRRHALSPAALAAALLSALSAGPASVGAQVIAVKTAPIAEGAQIGVGPEVNLGRGGIAIATVDSTLDAFQNPAKGARLRGTRFFAVPTFVSVSRDAGGGTTLPFGASLERGAWFSQFALAVEQVDRGGSNQQVLFPPPLAGVAVPLAVPLDGIAPPPTTEDRPSRQNRYLHASVGRRVGPRGLSLAGSASWWDMNAVDGVDLYYPRAQSVRQHGDALDLRLGLFKEWRPGHALELVLLRNTLGMTQDVSISQTFWDPTQRQFVAIARVEPNADRSETWGLHLGYTRPLADSGWRVGGILTANRIRQPRLPGYDLPQVPADAGRAQAYNIGAGVSRSGLGWTAGVDAIFEPIWNRSWVRADEAIATAAGTTLATGERTLDSRFRFANGIIRAGGETSVALSEGTSMLFEAGGQLRAVRYHLDQRDAVTGVASASTQSWNEWSRSLGLGVRLAGAELRYRARLTTGAGRPGFDNQGGVILEDAAVRPGFSSSSFAFFPQTTFGDVRVTTHQISVSVAVR